jgi:hypothetical protein
MRHSCVTARLASLLVAFFLLASFVQARQTRPSTRAIPEWAKRAVWYRIIPDRFSNGDPMNDPKEGDVAGAPARENPANWRMSPWTADWYALQPWETGDTAH